MSSQQARNRRHSDCICHIKDSKIVNDPNEWSDDPSYILELLQKVVTVSMRTVEIVSALPELNISE